MRDDDEGGALMLLAAFLLCVGFIAVTLLGARVARLPDQVASATRDPVTAEMPSLRDGICRAVQAADATGGAAEIAAALRLLEDREAQRGFLLHLSVDLSGPSPYPVDVDLSDGRTRVATSYSIPSSGACPA